MHKQRGEWKRKGGMERWRRGGKKILEGRMDERINGRTDCGWMDRRKDGSKGEMKRRKRWMKGRK